MTVLWQRKRNLIISAIVGVTISGLVFGTIAISALVKTKKYKDKISALDADNNSRHIINVCVLARDMSRGDEISENDLIEKKVYTDEDIFYSSKNELVGKVLKIDTGYGTAVSSNIVYENEDITDDVRLQAYTFIELHDKIILGSYVDIRIMFPNGEDYIIARHKRIEGRNEDVVTIAVNEDEILRMSAAKVDMDTYSGAKVYAVVYVKDYQEPSMVDYPPNSHVCQLGNWDPNLLERVFDTETVNKRSILEMNLQEFMEK